MTAKSLTTLVLIFVIISCLPVVISGNSVSNKRINVDDNNTIGPWDGTLERPYQYIQDGINHSNNGDTVFVYSGTYHENLLIRKSIFLIGEDRKNTLIIGNMEKNVISVEEDSVFINGFTIKNGYNGISVGNFDILFNNVRISGNIIINNSNAGVSFNWARYNSVIENNISYNTIGIDCTGFYHFVKTFVA